MPVGAAIGIGGLAGAGASIYAANKQSDAANRAVDLQQQQQQQTQKNLAPYLTTGSTATNLLTQQLPALTAPIRMDQATLEATPGYQFTLGQGLKSVQNSAAARGLGTSGAALKGAASFATGLADNTYEQQFGNALANKNFALNALTGAAGIGEGAATGQGQLGQTAATNSGNLLIGGATAQGAGGLGAVNSLTNAGNSYLGYKLAQDNLANQNLLLGNMYRSVG